MSFLRRANPHNKQQLSSVQKSNNTIAAVNSKPHTSLEFPLCNRSTVGAFVGGWETVPPDAQESLTLLGATVGTRVSNANLDVGCVLGAALGLLDGLLLGTEVGCADGASVG